MSFPGHGANNCTLHYRYSQKLSPSYVKFQPWRKLFRCNVEYFTFLKVFRTAHKALCTHNILFKSHTQVVICLIKKKKRKKMKRRQKLSPAIFFRDLSDTAIAFLPTEGLRELEVLKVQDTETLKVFPSVFHFQVNFTFIFVLCDSYKLRGKQYARTPDVGPARMLAPQISSAGLLKTNEVQHLGKNRWCLGIEKNLCKKIILYYNEC